MCACVGGIPFHLTKLCAKSFSSDSMLISLYVNIRRMDLGDFGVGHPHWLNPCITFCAITAAIVHRQAGNKQTCQWWVKIYITGRLSTVLWWDSTLLWNCTAHYHFYFATLCIVSGCARMTRWLLWGKNSQSQHMQPWPSLGSQNVSPSKMEPLL